jgi:AraC family transcriptional regulator
LAKIALELERALERRRTHGEPGRAASQTLARGDGWTAADVVCTSGPRDRPFEEQHTHCSIAVVVAGSFQYRSHLGEVLMTPGSLMLGNAGQYYECGHEHAEGDRCVAFWFTPEYFERIAADAGLRGSIPNFTVPRVAAVRPLARIAAAAAIGVVEPGRVEWEELGIALAAHALTLTGGAANTARGPLSPLNVVARVTRVLRALDRQPDTSVTLGEMARDARVSPFSFLRTFERLTGVTPHQYKLRTRLRAAALQLAAHRGKIVDVALDCGFGDVSNFNHAFRAEFGVSPRLYRTAASGLTLPAVPLHPF